MKDEGGRMKDQGGTRKHGAEACPSAFRPPPSAFILHPSSFILYPLSFILLSAALLVGWRRLAGALSQPLAPAAMVLVAASVAGLTALARSRRPTAAWSLLLSAAVLLLGIALCVRGTAGGGLLAFWAVLAAEEGWGWGRLLLGGRRKGGGIRDSGTMRSMVVGIRGVSVVDDGEKAIPAENILQKLTLSQDADGARSS